MLLVEDDPLPRSELFRRFSEHVKKAAVYRTPPFERVEMAEMHCRAARAYAKNYKDFRSLFMQENPSLGIWLRDALTEN